MHWKRAAPLILVVCAIVGAAAPVFAQAVQTASLTGTVKDGSGAVLPGVTVNVSSPSQVGGVQTSVSDSQGIYRFPALRPGIYQMETTLAGFKGVRATTSPCRSARRSPSTSRWPSRRSAKPFR